MVPEKPLLSRRENCFGMSGSGPGSSLVFHASGFLSGAGGITGYKTAASAPGGFDYTMDIWYFTRGTRVEPEICERN